MTPSLRRIPPARMQAAELEAHIADCERLWRAAYERFQQHGNPADRDEALLHLHRQNEAILARSPAVQAARNAEFERIVDEGVGYFTSEHARQLGMQYRRTAA